MSPRYSQSAGDSRPAEDGRRSFTTGIGSMVAPTADDETAPPAQPTFTAKPATPTVAPVPEPTLAPDDATVPELDPVPDDAAEPETTVPAEPALGPDDGAAAAAEPDAEPGAGPAPYAGLAPADEGSMRPRPLPATAGLDEPLLSDAAGLRARWQRVQAGFVDDPQEAVGDAADLIEQTAQAMVGALRQRQRQLRVMWEHGPADDSASADSEPAVRGSDTEHLRQMMQRYRALFNQLCRP
jgi:hypothetical protein